MKKLLSIILAAVIVFTALPLVGLVSYAETYGDFNYSVSNGEVTVLSYSGNAEDLVIPDRIDGYPVTEIGERAFSNLSIKTVTFGENIKKVGFEAFESCSSLTEVHISSIESWARIDFEYCKEYEDYIFRSNPLFYAHNLYIGDELVTDAVIDGDIDKIGDVAFAFCTSLKTLKIKGNVVKIGDCAFRECTELTSVTVDSDADSVALGYGVFYFCSSLVEFEMPFGTRVLKSYDEVGTYVGVFGGCSSLKSIRIPSSVEEIQGAVFYACNALTDVYYSGTKDVWGSISISDYSDYGEESYNSALNRATIHCSDGDILPGSHGGDDPGDDPGENPETGGWVEEKGNKYYYVDGQKVTGWKMIEGDWYYFSETGIMKTGWVRYNGRWYYLSSYGYMETGWLEYNGDRYYLNSDGSMKTGWLKLKHSGFSYDGSSGYRDMSSPEYDWFYFDEDGIQLFGWKRISGKWYYFDDLIVCDGSMLINWHEINGKEYYFAKDGVMRTGWVKVYDGWFYFGTDGALNTGWKKINGKWYYFEPESMYNGVMRTGWQKINNKWYYFGGANDGVMKTGWKKINGKWYYFGGADDGVMKTGWVKSSGKWYYMDTNGAMVYSCSKTIKGKTYKFDANGVCTNP